MRQYDLIDEMPLFNWEQCINGNINYCRIDPKSKFGNEKQDLKAWENLYDQYLKKFGLSSDHQRIIDLKNELALAQCDYCIDGNTFLLNRIRMLETDIKDILERSQQGMSIDQCLIVLSKWLKFHLDKKKITCTEFQNYLKAFTNHVSEQQKITKKKTG